MLLHGQYQIYAGFLKDMGKIKVILYDVDGTIVDATNIHYQSFNEALQNCCGFILTTQEHILNFNGLPTKIKLQKLISQNRITKEAAQTVWDRKQEYTIKAINELLKFDEQKTKMHHELKRLGLKLACVTNAIRASAELMLQLTGQLEFMDFVLTNEDFVPKPDPDGYIKAMQRLHVAPEECLICEDSEKGILAARASGAKVLVVKDPSEVNIQNILKELK